jgi:VacB/RNase II family 3'-5' exoribonuclease
MEYHASVDLKALATAEMEKNGFDPVFPSVVLQEVEALTESIPTREDVTDLRDLLWSSIDNIDSQDLDQIEYCERLPNGDIRVKIAISDVDLWVHQRSKTDRHAAHNGTSVYAGVETFPLLPDRLSKGLTSLLPGSDHRVIVMEYTILADGAVQAGNVIRALVSNRAKLNYEEVGGWLEGSSPYPQAIKEVPGMEEQLHLQHEAAIRLRQYRMIQGALDLETSEPEVVMKEDTVQGLVEEKKNAARTIIEEFMIAANGTATGYLEKAGIPMIQRVVRVPKYWDAIVVTAAEYGETLPAEPDSKSLSMFLMRRKEADPARFPDLSLTIVKLLGAGEYMPLFPGEPPYGHFGLAVTDYTHGTAPNRRYVDLVIQRLIKSVLDGNRIPYTYKELSEQSAWLTDREKASKKVERFMRKAAAAVLLKDRIGEFFDGFITGVTRHGTFARIITPPAEGKIVQGEETLRVGQKVHLRLLKTDPYNGHIDFACSGRKNF